MMNSLSVCFCITLERKKYCGAMAVPCAQNLQWLSRGTTAARFTIDSHWSDSNRECALRYRDAHVRLLVFVAGIRTSSSSTARGVIDRFGFKCEAISPAIGAVFLRS